MLGKLLALVLGILLALWLFEDTDSALDSLDGKRVLVTGASAGIGRQLAYEFSRHGCHVTVTARRRNILEEVSRECAALGPGSRGYHVVVGDMANMNTTQDVVQQAVDLMGGLDLIVLNHIHPHPIRAFKGDNSSLDKMHHVMDVNFRSYVHLASHALPHLEKSRGRIVVINSLMGKLSHPLLASYVASKHALDGFFASLRSQFRFTGQDIGVTSCFLGYIDTESAMRGLETSGATRLLSLITPASADLTAKAIVRATASGQDELYYPWLDIRSSVLLDALWPGALDGVLRWLAEGSGVS